MKQKTKNRLLKKLDSYDAIVKTKIFKNYSYSGNLEETCQSIEKYKEVIAAYIRLLEMYNCEKISPRKTWLTKKERRKSREMAKRFVNFRATREGDYSSLETIENNLAYIADRFRSPHRLRWLIQVPEKVANFQINK